MKKASVVLVFTLILTALAFAETGYRNAEGQTDYASPEFWRHEALVDIIPFWDKAIDRSGGGFFTDIGADGIPGPAKTKYVRMVSRMVYAYSAAYLLGGNDDYLDRARHGMDFLAAKGWDAKRGGWVETVSADGTQSAGEKNLFDETYGNLGPVMYYFATGDERALALVRATHELITTKARDPKYGGYYASVNGDWSVSSTAKSFNAQMDTCTAYLLYYYLATRDPALLEDVRNLANVARDRMLDAKTGAVGETFSRSWESTESTLWVGHNLKTGWVLMRAYWLTGDASYAEAARKIARTQGAVGWDDKYGGWFFQFHKGQKQPSDTTKDWWTQTEGNFLMMNLWRLDGDQDYLEKFARTSAFWDRYLMDHERGDCWQNRARNGSGSPQSKGYRYKAAYHTMEHALMNYLYCALYRGGSEATLHFRFSPARASETRFVMPVEYPGARIARVEIDGKDWKDFDPEAGSVRLPAGTNLRVTVTYRAVSP